jgi:hypothetical protein
VVFVVILVGSQIVVAADGGRPLVFALPSLAALFAAALTDSGTPAIVLPRTLEQLAALFAENSIEPDRFRLVEAETESAEDAISWTRELAGRVAR